MTDHIIVSDLVDFSCGVVDSDLVKIKNSSSPSNDEFAERNAWPWMVQLADNVRIYIQFNNY